MVFMGSVLVLSFYFGYFCTHLEGSVILRLYCVREHSVPKLASGPTKLGVGYCRRSGFAFGLFWTRFRTFVKRF